MLDWLRGGGGRVITSISEMRRLRFRKALGSPNSGPGSLSQPLTSPIAASEVTQGHSPLLGAVTVVGTRSHVRAQDHGRAEHGQQLPQNLLAVHLEHYFVVAVLFLWLQMLVGVGWAPGSGP